MKHCDVKRKWILPASMIPECAFERTEIGDFVRLKEDPRWYEVVAVSEKGKLEIIEAPTRGKNT